MISSVSVKYSYYKYVLWTLYTYILVVEWVPKIWFSGITGISHKNGLNWRQVEQGQIFACDDFPNFRSAFSSILHFKKSIKCGKNEEKPYGTCIQDIQFRVYLPPLFSTYLPSKKEPAGFFFNSTYVRKVKLRHFLQKKLLFYFQSFWLIMILIY